MACYGAVRFCSFVVRQHSSDVGISCDPARAANQSVRGKEMNEIKRGCVARCSLGLLGLVTSDTKVLTRYGDQAWMGVQLDPDKAGKEWCSRNPTFVANSVAELINNKKKEAEHG
jgi:hypothetical protein